MYRKIVNNTTTMNYYGSSKETKPTPEISGDEVCTLYETDTRRSFIWIDNEWVLNKNITFKDFRKLLADIESLTAEVEELKSQINQ